MKRWKITFENDQELLLYAETQTDIDSKAKTFSDIGEVKSIQEYTDTSYMEYINKIKHHAKFAKSWQYNKQINEIYVCDYYKGTILIKLSKDATDNTYYDYAEYQEHINNRIIQPITRTMSSPEKVWNIISIKEPQYIVYSHRYYGEPKLSKPKELNGIKHIGTATFIPKKCNPQVFIKNNDVYIKHTDYFSSNWIPPKGEKIDMPISYYMKKYFNKDKKDKFVYPDGWGDIVLRNEAWILLKDIIPLIKTENEVIAAQIILKLQQQERKYSHINSSNECEWTNFWERVVKCIKAH